VSEVDVTGQVLSTFTDVDWPYHLSTDSQDHVFVADCLNDRILLLNSKLQLERVLVDTDSEVDLQWPLRLHYNELTSQLHVVHETDCFVWCSSDSSDDDDDDDDDGGDDDFGGGGSGSGSGSGDDDDDDDDDDDCIDRSWRISVFSL